MRWRILSGIAILTAAITVLLIFTLRPIAHTTTVKAYFSNGMGLRPGAQVRLAGVEVGSVKGVRPYPEVKDAPVEVMMTLSTPYELKIPNDSTVSLQTAGLLGETFVEIDTTAASGPPIQVNGILKSKTTTPLSPEQILEKVRDVLTKTGCDCDGNTSGRITSSQKSPSHVPAVPR